MVWYASLSSDAQIQHESSETLRFNMKALNVRALIYIIDNLLCLPVSEEINPSCKKISLICMIRSLVQTKNLFFATYKQKQLHCIIIYKRDSLHTRGLLCYLYNLLSLFMKHVFTVINKSYN